MTRGSELLEALSRVSGRPSLPGRVEFDRLGEQGSVQVLWRNDPQRVVVAVVFDSLDRRGNQRRAGDCLGILRTRPYGCLFRSMRDEEHEQWIGIELPAVGELEHLAAYAAGLAEWLVTARQVSGVAPPIPVGLTNGCSDGTR